MNELKTKPKISICCTEMKKTIEKSDIIEALDVVPFIGTPEDKITVYICSDGGHGGMLPITYCPFCGTKMNTYY